MFFSPKWAAIVVALASMALLAGPASAGAAIDPTVTNTLLTVVGDGEDDTIAFSVIQDNGENKIAINGVATALVADANAEIVVDSGGGADTVSAAALTAGTYKSLVVSGGDGNDLLTGGANGAINDILNGNAGNDTLTGGKGGDTANGGEGDDVMIWNNGDASDVNNGEAGNDEVVINGNDGGADVITYRPEGDLDRAVVARTNVGLFTVDFDAEHLTVNGLKGNDTTLPDPAAPVGLGARTSLVVNGGEGDDNITGGDGNDRLVGGKETDTVNGGPGDDLMVWNNGDGSDVNDGGDGNDTVQSNGNGTPEVYTYRAGAAAGQVHFERANNAEGKGGFSIDLVAEHLEINSLAGDDSFEEPAGQPTPLTNQTQITVNAGADNDIVFGSAGSDTLNGDEGNDTLVGRKGALDIVSGGAGDDQMIWNNGEGSDVNDGGDGNDTVLSNGADANEQYAYEPKPEDPARVLFKRTGGLPAFTIDFTAEQLVVNSLGGVDTFEAPNPGLKDRTLITVNGGNDNDVITGGDGNDTLNGDAGNDELIGAKGADTANGGEGDDLMVWKNGDGSDVNDGGDGNDTVRSDGNDAAGEVYRYRPNVAPAPTQVHFERLANAQGAGAFTIDFTAENLAVNSLGGDDNLDASAAGLNGLTLITVNAGAGNDVVGGGDGNDALNGDAGNDSITGNKGGDAVKGGEGDDLMTWNNGDGSDVNDGDAGVDTVINNGNPGAEVYNYKPGATAGRVLFNRLPNAQGAGAFSIDFTAEKLVVNGQAGDDRFEPTGGPLAALAITINAGDGNDTVVGAEGNDTLSGDAGDDTVLGGLGNDNIVAAIGSDVIDGQDGNDALASRDKQNDLVRGGAGTDSAVTDELTIDSVSGVEQLDATPPVVPLPPPVPPAKDTVAIPPTLGKATAAMSGKKLLVKVPVSCPAAETGGCRTTLTVETAKAARLSALRAVVVLGSKTVNVGPGARATASIRLASGAAALAANGKLPVRIRIASSDSAGNTATRTVAATLKVPRS